MSIRNRLAVYVVSLLLVCIATAAGSIYLVIPLYTGLIQHAAVMAALHGIIIIIAGSGLIIFLCALICAVMMVIFICMHITHSSEIGSRNN